MENKRIEFTNDELKVIAIALQSKAHSTHGNHQWLLDGKNKNYPLFSAYDKVLKRVEM